MKPASPSPAANDPHTVRGMSDDALFQALSGGKATADRAFAELYSRHSTRIWAYCRTVFGDHVQAEDVFQEAFTRFLEQGQKGTAVRNVPAYLLIITRNLCLNAKRDAKESVAIEEFHMTVNDRPFENKELLELVNRAMALLTEEQREAFFLREYEDLPYNDISAVLGITALSARLRVSRARQRIREILQPYVAELTQS